MTAEKSADAGAEFTRLLEYLRSARGFDFTGYKVSSLMRRMRKRMGELGIASFGEYTEFLEVHPEEFAPLFTSVLINVTSFFRDAEAWQYLAEQIVPRLLEDRPPDALIRIWSAGCATGEEAYTLAMVFAEAMGEAAFRARVKIYATDADGDALAQARQGSYDGRRVADVPPQLLARYFEPVKDRHVFRKDFRRSLIFGRHDLVQDASISRVDLLACRNTLMYFNGEAQARILARFHFALAKDGYLFLGKAETLLSHGGSFRPVHLKHRVFQRTWTAGARDHLLALSPLLAAHEEAGPGGQLELREAAFDRGPIAQLMVDRKGFLVLANERARALFGLAAGDLGRPLQDLEVSYRPIDLRSAIDEAIATRATVVVGGVAWPAARPGDSRHLELQASPVEAGSGEILGTSLSFLDVTQARSLKLELERTLQQLETANEELQSSNEELETTNEELQSAVEELETTNEELQSANEELETMNEELQSTNEELRTINDQVVESADAVNEANDLLESILGRLNVGAVVLAPDLSVAVWSQRAEDLWGLRKEETLGQPFLKMDIGIPLQALRRPIQDCLDGGADGDGNGVSIDGVNRRGKPIRCRIHCTLLPEQNGKPHRVLLIMTESPRLAGAAE